MSTMCFWSLDVWGLAGCGGTAPPRAGQFLDIVIHSGVCLSYANKPMRANPKPQPPSLSGSHTLGRYQPAPNTLDQRQMSRGQPLRPGACWYSSNWPILSLLTLSHPCLPMETTIEVLVHIFPHSFCPLADPGASSWPCMGGRACPLFLGTATDYLLSSSPLLICLSCRIWTVITSTF